MTALNNNGNSNINNNIYNIYNCFSHSSFSVSHV